jgi:hypothetical protein
MFNEQKPGTPASCKPGRSAGFFLADEFIEAQEWGRKIFLRLM